MHTSLPLRNLILQTLNEPWKLFFLFFNLLVIQVLLSANALYPVTT